MPNTNPETGVAYGYVAANDLDGDVVHELLWGLQAQGEDTDEDGCDEEHRWGTYEGVSYETSWLGGALSFFIIHSPYIVKGHKASPCVPGACILNKGREGSEEGYGVPEDWWSKY